MTRHAAAAPSFSALRNLSAMPPGPYPTKTYPPSPFYIFVTLQKIEVVCAPARFSGRPIPASLAMALVCSIDQTAVEARRILRVH